MNKFRNISLLVCALVLFFNCSDEDDLGGNSDNFDRGSMLVNVADNVIIPAFQDLKTKLTSLKSSKNDFISSPNQSNLDNLRSSWLSAYKVWQYVEMFNIGKAEELLYNFQMNVYPVNVSDIENNVTTGTYDLTHPNNNDAVGFPALDFLLYGVGNNDNEIIEKYTVGTTASGYKTYLSDVVNHMESLTQTVLNDWTTNYRSQFVNNTTNTSTSALNKLVNDYIFYYEKGLRANKIGIPAGNFSSTPLPEKVEAYYNKEVSKELTLTALKAVQDFFTGKYYNSGSTGSSYKTYLEFLNKTELANSITSQFNDARVQIQTLDNNFYDQINTNNVEMTKAYDELQKAVVMLKVDMLQAFNVNVDYVDADGD